MSVVVLRGTNREIGSHLTELARERYGSPTIRRSGYHELRGAPADRLEPIVSRFPGCRIEGRSPDGSLRVVFDEGVRPSALLGAVESAGIEGVEIRSERVTLESLFLEVTGIRAGGQVD